MQKFSNFYNSISSMINEHYAQKEKKSSEDLKEWISLQLKLFRSERRMSQDDLSVKLGVSRRQVIRWEDAKCTPSNLALQKMKDELGIERKE